LWQSKWQDRWHRCSTASARGGQSVGSTDTLRRLIKVAQSDTGQSRRVAPFSACMVQCRQVAERGRLPWSAPSVLGRCDRVLPLQSPGQSRGMVQIETGFQKCNAPIRRPCGLLIPRGETGGGRDRRLAAHAPWRTLGRFVPDRRVGFSYSLVRRRLPTAGRSPDADSGRSWTIATSRTPHTAWRHNPGRTAEVGRTSARGQELSYSVRLDVR
jgi:hypothetical protein